MKVFDHHGAWPKPVDKAGVTGEARKGRAKKEAANPQPKAVDAKEVREKVELNKLQKDRIKTNRPTVISSMPELPAPAENGEVSESDEVIGDIKKNDPKDPATVGKLKELLKTGAVNFSDQQRDVLSKVIGKNDS